MEREIYLIIVTSVFQVKLSLSLVKNHFAVEKMKSGGNRYGKS